MGRNTIWTYTDMSVLLSRVSSCLKSSEAWKLFFSVNLLSSLSPLQQTIEGEEKKEGFFRKKVRDVKWSIQPLSVCHCQRGHQRASLWEPGALWHKEVEIFLVPQLPPEKAWCQETARTQRQERRHCGYRWCIFHQTAPWPCGVEEGTLQKAALGSSHITTIWNDQEPGTNHLRIIPEKPRGDKISCGHFKHWTAHSWFL